MRAFWRQVLTVLGGAVTAQALPLLAAPLLTRLCTPPELGAFGLWFGLASVGAIGATLRLEAALILDHEAEQQRTGLSVILWSATRLALLMSLIAMTAHWLGWPVFGSMHWLAAATLGLGTWLFACQQSLQAFATSHRAFGPAARVKILTAAMVTLIQLSLLWLDAGVLALVGGQLLGTLIGLAGAAWWLRPPLPHAPWRRLPARRSYLERHRNFWRYALPAGLLNASVGPLPLVLISLHHGPLAAGLYALTQRVVAAPVSLVAASVLEVFKRQSVQEFQALGHCSSAYQHTFRSLVALGALPALILLLQAPQLFAFVFGENWRAAGDMARVLAPLCFLNFVAAPLSYVFFVAGKQREELRWQVCLVSMTLLAFNLPPSLGDKVLSFVLGYSLLYLVYMRLSYRYALGEVRP